MNNMSFPKPSCAVCGGLVTVLSAERRFVNYRGALRDILLFMASCHGQTETMALPAQLLLDPNLKIMRGTAFKQAT